MKKHILLLLSIALIAFKIQSQTEYKVEVETTNGCMSGNSTSIDISSVVFSEQICLVTVDNQTGKNKIIWEKTKGKSIKEYKIYKESNAAGRYDSIGTVPYNDLSIFIDSNSNPSQRAYRYRIVTVDSSENQSEPSTSHQTINLMIAPGLPGTYNLNWSHYAGFDFKKCYIYKGNSPDSLMFKDSIARTFNQYTDSSEGISYYQVAVRKTGPCYPSLLKAYPEAYSQSVSNINNNLTAISKVEIDKYLSIYPNPFDNILKIEYLLNIPSDLNISLFNALGEHLYQYKQKKNCSKLFKHTINFKELKGTSQIYVIRFEVNGMVVFRKLIKLR